jgi:hypothetical protein
MKAAFIDDGEPPTDFLVIAEDTLATEIRRSTFFVCV